MLSFPENEPVEEVESPSKKKRDKENDAWKLDFPFDEDRTGEGLFWMNLEG